MRATAHVPEQAAGSCVLLCHGFKGFKDWGFHPHLGAALADAGHLAVRFDFSHNGVDDDPSTFARLDLFERNTWSREIEDLEIMRTYLATGRLDSWNVSHGKMFVIGHSRGGGIALLHAARHRGFAGIITLSAISHLDRFSEAEKKLAREDGTIPIPNARTGQLMPVGYCLEEDRVQNFEHDAIAKAIARIESPILLLHGTEDETLPLSEAEHLAAAARNATFFPIEGASHTYGVTHPFQGDTPQWQAARSHVLGFLRNHS